MLEPIDRLLSDYLSTFDMPENIEDIIEQLVTLYESTSNQQNDTNQRQRQAEAHVMPIAGRSYGGLLIIF